MTTPLAGTYERTEVAVAASRGWRLGDVVNSLRRAPLTALVARPSTLALADQAVVSGASFATTVIVGRLAGPDELGIYSLGATLAILISSIQESLISLPYTIYGTRGDTDSRSRYAGSVLVHHGVLVVLTVTVLVAGGVATRAGFGPARLSPLLFALAVAAPFFLLREFARRFAFADLDMRAALRIDSAVAAMQVIGLIALAAAGRASAITAYTVVGLSCGIASLSWMAGARARFRISIGQVVAAGRRNWLIGKWALASRLASNLNSDFVLLWLIAALLGHTATGVFAACMAIVGFSNPFVIGIGNFLTPRIARAFTGGGTRELRRVVLAATLFMGGAMTTFCIGLVAVGAEVTRLAYGDAYAGHDRTLVLLALAVLAAAISVPAGNGLLVLERPDVNFKTSVLGFVVAALMGSWFMAWWGVPGAAAGLLVGYIVDSATRCGLFFRLLAAREAAVVRDRTRK